MASLWVELKRRNVVKVGAAYAVVGWLSVQIAATFFPALQLPAWAVTLVASLVILGFPLALVLAWAYELTPDGIERVGSAQTSETAVKGAGRKLDFAIIGALVLALGFLVYNDALDESGDSTAQNVNVLPNSIAVLPFDNLSPDPDDAYFAAGIHESTLNQLAQIEDLAVIARTSVLQYQDNPRPIPEIAEALNVETVMEGSVRYADDRVLITVQLIDGQTGAHLWSEEFNRSLRDIFSVQAEIAALIAMELEAEFSPAEQERIGAAPTESAAAYSFYLRSLESMNTNSEAVIAYAERAIELDQNFALAHAIKARVLATAYAGEVAEAAESDPGAAAELAAELEREVVATAERALELDPGVGLAHAALGVMHLRRWREEEAEAAFARALELSPNDPEVLSWNSYFHSYAGQSDLAIDAAHRAVEIDPDNRIFELAEAYFFAGKFDAAAAIHQQMLADDDPESGSYRYYAEIETARGNYDTVVENLRIGEQLGLGGAGTHARAAYAYSRAGRTEDAMRLFLTLQERSPGLLQLAVGNLAIGDTDAALELLQASIDSELPQAGSIILMIIKNNLYADPVLERPEFIDVRSNLGFR